MKILNFTGQTCNKFWTYSNQIANSIETGEKIVILSPDISIQDYPSLRKSDLIIFPFYNQHITKILGYKRYINLLGFLFLNKIAIYILNILLKSTPSIDFINKPEKSKKSEYFIKNSQTLKTLFTPDISITKYVENVIYNKKVNFDVIVGIHIRLGDYKTYMNGKYYYSLKEYNIIMKKMQDLLPNKKVAFFISSNEFIDFSVFDTCSCFSLPKSSAIKDLYGLGLTDYILGPPSTFSGWASFYGKVPLYFIENTKEEFSIKSFRSILEIWGYV